MDIITYDNRHFVLKQNDLVVLFFFFEIKMELTSSTNFTTSFSSQTSVNVDNTTRMTTTTPMFISHERLFLHTVACQAIAGAFTWAAIFITGHHVRQRFL